MTRSDECLNEANKDNCQCVDGHMGAWGPWGECKVSCNSASNPIGHLYCSRDCMWREELGGRNCTGEKTEEKKLCDPLAKNPCWQAWEPWGDCVASCNNSSIPIGHQYCG
jgi:hypothetical protein